MVCADLFVGLLAKVAAAHYKNSFNLNLVHASVA